MNENERDILRNNKDLLLRQTNDQYLTLELFISQAISESVFNNIKSIEDDELRKNHLFDVLLSSRTLTFCNLLNSYVKTGHFDIAKILKPDINLESYFTENDNRTRKAELEVASLTSQIHDLRLMPSPLTITVENATDRLDLKPSVFDPYLMGTRPKGYLLMINNVEFINNIHEVREGALIDEKNMEELFKQLGFKVITYRNQGHQDMLRKIDEFKEMQELRNVACIFVAILSHGRAASVSINESMVTTSDGRNILTSDIYNKFSNQLCPHLINTPKVFIFQCCRGEQMDFGIRNRPLQSRTRHDGYVSMQDDNEPVRYPRIFSDMLIAYSTLPGFKANRDIYMGTWYINKICEVFMKHAKEMHVEDMFRLVDIKLGQLRSESGLHQTSMFENRGFRHLFLNPGLDDYTCENNDESRLSPNP